MTKIERHNFHICIQIPFPSKREAEVAYQVLIVDAEPPRSSVIKELKIEETKLTANFSSVSAKQLRVAVNAYFNKVLLIGETLEAFGTPTTPEYSFK